MAGKGKLSAAEKAASSNSKVSGKGKGKGEAKTYVKDQSSGSDAKLKAATAINVRHILCEKFSRKEDALGKLQQGGKFDEVAREFSEDKQRQGENNAIQLALIRKVRRGALGWKVRGSLNGAFEKAAYDLEPSTTNNPIFAEVKTVFGYHIIMVEGRR
ncbi:MAG: Peptidyl-prolyl cis-trans isomerase pin4 [Trizodia sp. TS-e1964]|nr:MAG: Peptidyl-prolyl cis-trans isomerase pin4 [Trizodia sp. TS-e1964]